MFALFYTGSPVIRFMFHILSGFRIRVAVAQVAEQFREDGYILFDRHRVICHELTAFLKYFAYLDLRLDIGEVRYISHHRRARPHALLHIFHRVEVHVRNRHEWRRRPGCALATPLSTSARTIPCPSSVFHTIAMCLFM